VSGKRRSQLDRLFRNALLALDSGDVEKLKALLEANPGLSRYQCRTGDRYERGYFAGATLLHHIAGNPIRCPLPSNIIDVARVLVSHGFDATAGAETIGLLLTSKQASEAGVAAPLIDLLVEAGAEMDWSRRDLLDNPLLNVAPATARALIARGAKMELRHAAGLGDLEALARLYRPQESDEALIYACIRGQTEAAAWLIHRGGQGDVLLQPGGQTLRTALHEAANRGHIEIVSLLLESGARTDVIEPRWEGTPAGWADHGGHPEIAELLRR